MVKERHKNTDLSVWLAGACWKDFSMAVAMHGFWSDQIFREWSIPHDTMYVPVTSMSLQSHHRLTSYSIIDDRSRR